MKKPHPDHVNHLVMLLPLLMMSVALLMFAPLFNWPGDESIVGIPVKVAAIALAIFFTPLLVLTQILIHLNVDYDDEAPPIDPTLGL